VGIFWKFTSPLGISVGAVIRWHYRIAVGRGRRLWVESGRLTHVPELFVTAHDTGNPR
jgi:hypothetical protein